MAKARRRLSDLVQEETQKVGEQNLQTSEVTTSDSLPETPNTEQQDSEITNLQTSEVTTSDSLPETPNTEQQDSEITNLQTSEVTKSDRIPTTLKTTDLVEEVTEQQTFNITDSHSTELPKYLKLERKEARLRQDQIDALTDLTRKLNRIKRGKGGERLTDNTLIRVAVDLLLSKASDLRGTTEEELRSSLDL